MATHILIYSLITFSHNLKLLILKHDTCSVHVTLLSYVTVQLPTWISQSDQVYILAVT